MLELDQLLQAALLSTDSWEKQERMLRGLGFDDEAVEIVREAIAEVQGNAVARIVQGPEA